MDSVIQSVRKLSVIQIGMLLAFVPLGAAIWFLRESIWVPLFGVPVVLGGFYYREKLTASWKLVYTLAVLLIIAVMTLSMFRIVRMNIVFPPEYDFRSFWLNGRIGIQGLNFYDPEIYRQAAEPLLPTPEFTRQLLDSAFWYPPPSIVLFLPLGLFDNLQVAMVAWFIFLGFMLALTVWMMWKLFFANGGWLGVLVTVALILLHVQTFATMMVTQTLFILLLMFMLMWRDRDLPRSGVWLAFAILLKPFMAVLLLYMLLQKQWRSIAATIITLGVISLAVLLVFGTETFFAYNPLARMPNNMYLDWVNQSMLATILRLTNYQFGNGSPVMHPIFLIGAMIFTAVTAWIVYRLPKAENQWALLLTFMLGLVIYPATLQLYTLALLLPLLLIWVDKEPYFGGAPGKLAFITLVYVLFTHDKGAISFVAYLLCWFVIAAIAYRKLPNRSPQRLVPIVKTPNTA